MSDGLNFEVLMKALAELVAVKVRDGLAQDGTVRLKPRLMTVEQAAVYLGRTKEAVEHMIAAAKVPVVRADRRVFLDVRDLDRWIEANKS